MRTAFSFRRDLEFASAPELAKRMGCPRDLWLRAALKELIDNALDACEEAGVEPAIAVEVDGSTLTVADNGPGVPPDLVERLCNRAERTSSREGFASPDRGAQGNFLQVAMALPLGFGRDEAVTTIAGCGVEHTIVLRINRLEGRIDVERSERRVPATPGTSVTLSWPVPINRHEVAALLLWHAWFNPHAAFDLNDGWWCAEPTAAVSKWPTSQPTPINWYSLERFEHRTLLELRHAPHVTVAQFVSQFAGLSSRSKQARIAAEACLQYQRLEALLDAGGTRLNPAPTQMLFEAMLAESRAPKPAILGAIGKATFEDLVANHASDPPREPQFLAYTTVDGVVQDEVPVRWELGIAHLPGKSDRTLLAGMNFSPAILPERMADDVLAYAGWHFGADQPIALLLHRISPDRQTLDYGKSRLGISYSEARQVADALAKIGKPWIRHANALIRGKRPPPVVEARRVTFQDAAFEAMADAYAKASSDGKYPVLSQQVFYSARPTILELTGKDELGPNDRARFCYMLLPHFMQGNPELTARWKVLYKPRGELIEPHSTLRVGLGTREVADYHAGWTNGLDLAGTDVEIGDWEPFTSGPHNGFGAVLIVEKGGIADVARQVGLGRRHDIAIVGNEGQSVEAELRLVDAFGRAGVPIFLLCDFDRQGFTIAENLRSGSWRHRYVTPPKIVHIGLRLDQIAALGGLASEQDEGGLEDEPIGDKARKHVSDDRLRACGATEAEIEILRNRRVELNALITGQLVGLVEAALAEHGVTKVIPNTEDLAAAWRAVKARADIAEAVEQANAEAAERWANAEAPDDLGDRVRAILERRPTLCWDEALRKIARSAP